MMFDLPQKLCFNGLFSLEQACPIAIAAIDFKVETSAASFARRIERTSTRALRTWGCKCHLGLAAFATGAHRAVGEYAFGFTPSAWASFLGVGSNSRTFSATYSHYTTAAANVAVACEVARTVAPQAFDSIIWEGIALKRCWHRFGVG